VPPAEPYRFNRPTDVTWDPQGNIFVADGYFNSRVVKYDKNGRFIKAVGTRGTEPYQMNIPHSITADAQGNIYVADRQNRRIQVFDSNLVLRAIYDNVGAPWAVCISPGPHQYLFSSNSNPDNNNSLLAAVSGEIYKMELDGTVIGKFGKPGKQLGEFSTVHRHRLPESRRTDRLGDHRVARTENHPQVAGAGAALEQHEVGGDDEALTSTPARRFCRASRRLGVGAVDRPRDRLRRRRSDQAPRQPLSG
jgi:sugar lactone lactonase YvrE